MPFTLDQFFDVFGRYNSLLWPAAGLLWLVSAATVAGWLRHGARASRLLSGVLALHWVWSGVAYHWAFFAAINPAAPLFAVLFLFQAVCLVWCGVVRPCLRFLPGRTGWKLVGYAFIVYAFSYPALSVASGHAWPRLPLFAVPCPTTLLTVGLLLTLDRAVPIAILVPTVAWTAIGGSAAILFDVRADFALPVAGVAVLAFTVTMGVDRWMQTRRRSAQAGAATTRR